MDDQRAKSRLVRWGVVDWCGRLVRWGLLVACFVVFVWSIGAVRYAPVVAMPGWAAAGVTVGYVVAVGAGVWVVRRWRLGRWGGWGTHLAMLAPAAVVFAVFAAAVRPSNDRVWSPDQSALAWAEIDGDVVTIHNLRSCVYRSTDDYDVHLRSEAFDLRGLERAWLVLEPLPRVPGGAHLMMSFGFEDGRALVVSVEVRREKGERFGPVRGLYRNFEMMYVVGDETDLIRLRTHHRGHEVYLYPVETSPSRLRAMLLHMLDRCNDLRERPEFYHTVLNNCATAVVRHANRVSSVRVPWTLPVVFPRHADELAHRLGLIPGDVGIDELRRRHAIGERARACPEGVEFSRWIRGE